MVTTTPVARGSADLPGAGRTEGGTSRSGDTVLALHEVSKNYGGVQALRDVSFSLPAGTVVGLVGDNGAGKSTLVRIVAGAESPSAGWIEIGGEPKELSNPRDAAALGITVVYQDLALALQQDVAANVFLGREILARGRLGRWLGWLDRAAMRERTAAALRELHTKIPDLMARCQNLSGGQRQALAIARAVMWCDKLLVLDEPTSALGVEQQQEVLDLVRRVRDLGIGVLFVSHQMADVASVCDQVQVLRMGRLVATLGRDEISPDVLVGHITGARGQVATDEGQGELGGASIGDASDAGDPAAEDDAASGDTSTGDGRGSGKEGRE